MKIYSPGEYKTFWNYRYKAGHRWGAQLMWEHLKELWPGLHSLLFGVCCCCCWFVCLFCILYHEAWPLSFINRNRQIVVFTSSLPQYILPEAAHILSVLYILLHYTSNEGVYSALKRKKLDWIYSSREFIGSTRVRSTYLQCPFVVPEGRYSLIGNEWIT